MPLLKKSKKQNKKRHTTDFIPIDAQAEEDLSNTMNHQDNGAVEKKMEIKLEKIKLSTWKYVI